jgi:hypothetical protein
MRIAFELEPRLACMFVSTSTRESISVHQAKEFTRTIEPSYIGTIPHLMNGERSGGVIIEDKSHALKKRNSGEGMQPVFVSLGYERVRRDTVSPPTAEAYRNVRSSGEAPLIKERIYLERGSEDGGLMRRTAEGSLERLSLMA